MKRYWAQLLIYTRYFSKVLVNNPSVLIYTVCLPVVFLVLNTQKLLFHRLSPTQFGANVVPFIAWIVFSNSLVAITRLGLLREQGYLKQYRTLVVGPSVLVLAELLVTLGEVLIILTLVGLACGLLFRLPPLPLLVQLWEMLLLVYFPTVCTAMPLLAIPLKADTLNNVLNALLFLVMFGSGAVSFFMTPSLTNPLINLVSPVYFEGDVFTALATGALGRYAVTYLLVTGVWAVIGIWSYRHLRLLPTERM